MWTFFYFILLFITSLIPILLWGYLFSYLDNEELNKKRFLIWVISWCVSVIPILYFPDIISNLKIEAINVFALVWNISWIKSVFFLILWFIFVLLLSLFFPFIWWLIWIKETYKYKLKFMILAKTIWIFSLYLSVFWFIFYFIESVSNYIWLEKSTTWINFWKIVFNSVKLVVFYYLLIWIIEELSKFFFFSFWKYFTIQTVKQWVLYTIFVALGFAFIENILYIHNVYTQLDGFSSDLIWVYITRNIFSIVCHVLCSAILWDFFSKAYLMFKYKLNFEFIKTIFYWFILSAILHAFFDIFLTFNFIWIIFIYIIWAYFYISYIFYKK